MNANPLLNSNKLKLGVFNFNGDGNSRTLVPERYQFNWPNSLSVAQEADRIGLEAIVPYARFRSIVGSRHKSAFVFENLTWSSAVAAKTNYSAVMSTIHVSNVHPIVAAKAMTTIDHVSNGRFALNIVCGWFKEETEMFGYEFLEHDERYKYASEWITIIKRLWEEQDPFDFEGKYFKIRSGMAQPKPIQSPRPMLMNAGGSPAGQEFVANHCDIAFVRSDNLEKMAQDAAKYRAAARERGRELQIWVYCGLVHGKTKEDALAMADRYASMPDESYLENAIGYKNPNISPADAAILKRKYTAAGSGTLLIGDADDLTNQLEAISKGGVDGVLLTWVDFQTGIKDFGAQILPRLEARGLRSPYRPASS